MLSFLFTHLALAIPVVNENVANSGVMTIYPDHADIHRYYIAPNVVMIAQNSAGVPYFSYSEYRKNLFQNMGVLNMTLTPAYTREELEGANADILKKDPAAQFSGVPFVASSLQLTGELPALIADNQCNHEAGLIGQEQACSLILTPKGRSVFLGALARKTIFTTLQFEYEIQAVIKLADGSFKDQSVQHGMAVRIDGDQLSNYPQLINRH
jgi:hypothetical protein